jgi:hypothetical protein
VRGFTVENLARIVRRGQPIADAVRLFAKWTSGTKTPNREMTQRPFIRAHRRQLSMDAFPCPLLVEAVFWSISGWVYSFDLLFAHRED